MKTNMNKRNKLQWNIKKWLEFLFIKLTDWWNREMYSANFFFKVFICDSKSILTFQWDDKIFFCMQKRKKDSEDLQTDFPGYGL